MFKFLGKLISEESTYSTVRAMSLICTVSAVLIGIYGIHENRDLTGVAELVGAFLAPAFAGKVGQKYFENKDSQSKNP